MGLTDFNRRHIHSTLFETNPHLGMFLQEHYSCFDIFTLEFYQIYQFGLGGQSRKTLHPSLSCKDLEQGYGVVKFRAAPVPAPGKMPRWLQEKCTRHAHRYHKNDSYDGKTAFLFVSRLLILLNLPLFRARDTLSLMILALVLSKMSCQLRLRKLFEVRDGTEGDLVKRP